MFGGFFAGEEGRKRHLTFDDVEGGTAGDFHVVRAGKKIAEGLRERPIECIYRALYAKLLRGAELAALAEPRKGYGDIRVDE